MRTKFYIFSAMLIAAILALPQSSSAQFVNGKTLLGPHIGLAAYGSAPSFGANLEIPVTQPGKAGPGIIGVSARFDYFSFGEVYYKYTWITLGVYGNYHFALEDKTWDPFLGLGLGYQNVSASYDGPFGGVATSGWGSGIFFSLQAGARYFFSDNLALRALLGFGITYIVVGLDFGL
jgi:hypothetical protein